MHSLSLRCTSFAFSSSGYTLSGVIASFGLGDIGAVDCGGTERTEPVLGKVPIVDGGREG